MEAFLGLTSIDPSIGKIDKRSFYQQTLMELLTAGITNPAHLYRSTEIPQDTSEWEHVKLNESSEIVKLNWFCLFLEGSIELRWLPLEVKEVFLTGNKLRGTIDLTFLPDILEVLNVGHNQFEGTVDLIKLPPIMKRLYLFKNKFYGKADFSQLPKSLEVLNVSNTHLEGEICAFDGDLRIENSNVKNTINAL